ncbi:NUDIX hydrolase [Actinoplanes ianthinogenes]|uniref:NUDIX hydrolase n=1 Tax=Actinoplanes ianthinogenes TaxID=122358 RepID=A0ABM7M9P3_9ACTN|nr:NUDIX hydrolase [Actinoplanes ianthinogenes]BCJ48379.1 NUDIX hydrolase [Actinoplanes ianthinogenes]GGR46783.1 NUDIX hydrolase [Actinoplanes ianthinogenes]
MTTPEIPRLATPRVAAGALFFDEAGRVLLVKPTYKEGWDIPGGYVESGESPRAACIREIQEELGVSVSVKNHLVIDWAPAENEGDKILFIFDAGRLPRHSEISFNDGELSEARFVAMDELDGYLSERLSRRIRTAVTAKVRGIPAYAEHGVGPEDSSH